MVSKFILPMITSELDTYRVPHFYTFLQWLREIHWRDKSHMIAVCKGNDRWHHLVVTLWNCPNLYQLLMARRGVRVLHNGNDNNNNKSRLLIRKHLVCIYRAIGWNLWFFFSLKIMLKDNSFLNPSSFYHPFHTYSDFLNLSFLELLVHLTALDLQYHLFTGSTWWKALSPTVDNVVTDHSSLMINT